MMSVRPWADAYNLLLEGDYLAQHSRFVPKGSHTFKWQSESQAFSETFVFLKQFFIPSPSVVTAMQRILCHAQGFAVSPGRDPNTYAKRLYGTQLPQMELDLNHTVICLTGPAGVGKTSLLRAIQRVMNELPVGSFKCPQHVNEAPIYLSRFATFRDVPTLTGLLTQLSRADEAEEPLSRAGITQLSNRCKQRFTLWNTCQCFVDETQFDSLSQTATAALVKKLLALGNLGIPLCYVLNFGMASRILGREPEASQRLMSHPIHLFPDGPETDAWRSLLSAYQEGVPGLFAFQLAECSQPIWNYCAGIKRSLIQLLSIAASRAFSSGRSRIYLEDVEKSYSTPAYRSYREQVERLFSVATTGNCSMATDNMSPFLREDSEQSSYLRYLSHAKEQQVVSEVARRSLSRDEWGTLTEVRRSTGGFVMPPTPKPKMRAAAGGLLALATSIETQAHERGKRSSVKKRG